MSYGTPHPSGRVRRTAIHRAGRTVGRLTAFAMAPVALALLSSCDQSQSPSGLNGVIEPPEPVAEIQDAAHSLEVEHFYFLPPIVPQPSFAGVFDGSLSPVVHICQLDAAGTACAASQPTGFPITFTTTTGPGSETVTVDATAEHYQTNWHTNDFALNDSESYRISVSVGAQELGFADVDVVNSGKDLKNVDTDEFIALKDGRTLPIKLRVEDGALDEEGPTASNVVGTPNPAAVGEDVTLTADVDDTSTGGSDIASAEYNVSGGAFVALAAQDGTFDSATETVEATIPGFASPGDRTVCVRGTDVVGNTGAESCITVSVQGFAWASITTGFNHACGVATDGTAYCWGSHGRGEGGLGLPIGFNTTPQPVAGGLTFDRIKAAAGEFSCGLTTSRDIYCWGTGENGQLGSSTVILIGCSGGTQCSPDPVLVESGISWTAVGGGEDHWACGLDAAGNAHCWGNIGQGDVPGSTGSSDMPVLVGGGLAFASMDVGAVVCGVTPAGDAYCWGGTNNTGELGDGTTNDSNLPVMVTGGHTFTQVVVAGLFACGLTDTGQALCWGFNGHGQLGVDPSTGPDNCSLTGFSPCSLSPVAVTGGHTFTKLSANGSSFHRGNVCGIATDGQTYCWGNNQEGQLGDGTIGGTRFTPAPVVGGHQFVDIGVSHGHVCGVTASGEAYCWGNNSAGQLGDATQVSSGVPVQVVDPM